MFGNKIRDFLYHNQDRYNITYDGGTWYFNESVVKDTTINSEGDKVRYIRQVCLFNASYFEDLISRLEIFVDEHR
jgi:hypothetical protein